ncbi:MAG: M15 family metallopeptidase [Gemmatimonadaceae bacterium]|nr:M15 family metallopeptidase [Gemmatimonadaceae bacterium]
MTVIALEQLLSGCTTDHLCTPEEGDVLGALVHRDALAPLLRLREAASREGFDLRLESGFRSFDRQLSIWNRKVRGELAVLDSNAQPLDIAKLAPRDLVFSILRWSALPGASRHHWGTDVDVVDAAATPAGYVVQLVPAEVEPGGMHAPLHAWLDERIATGTAHGFYRPYDRDRGGVAPERWHLSHAPLAAQYLPRLTLDVLRETVLHADLALKETVLEHLDEIHARFVLNVSPPPGGPVA